jgi:hypothetical protein
VGLGTGATFRSQFTDKFKIPSALEVGTEFTEDQLKLGRAPKVLGQCSRRACGGVLLLALLGLPACAWTQLTPGPATDAALPAAPDAQAMSKTAPAQSGSIHGLVVDWDGTVCEGAHVTLDEPGQPARSAVSDSTGRYDFGAVPAGAFQLTVSSDGFASQTITGVLHAGESFATPTVTLLVSVASSEVRVTASREEIAQEQFKEEEEQRLFRFIPNYYVSYVPDAPPLTPKQKFRLTWKTSIDPMSFLSTGVFAGIEQAENSYSGFGQGAQGYAKRYGASYADVLISTTLGNAVFPVLLKQDPRYFYKGTGSKSSRTLYAVANAVICKGDNGRWQPNYSATAANLAAGGISNLYYPAANRNGATLTFENAGVGLAYSAVENLFQEFLLRKWTPKIPDYGPAKP